LATERLGYFVLSAAKGCDGAILPSFSRNCSSNLSRESGTPPVSDFTDASSLVKTTSGNLWELMFAV